MVVKSENRAYFDFKYELIMGEWVSIDDKRLLACLSRMFK